MLEGKHQVIPGRVKGVQPSRVFHQLHTPFPVAGQRQVHPDDGEVVRMVRRQAQGLFGHGEEPGSLLAIEMSHGQVVIRHDIVRIQRDRLLRRLQGLSHRRARRAFPVEAEQLLPRINAREHGPGIGVAGFLRDRPGQGFPRSPVGFRRKVLLILVVAEHREIGP